MLLLPFRLLQAGVFLRVDLRETGQLLAQAAQFLLQLVAAAAFGLERFCQAIAALSAAGVHLRWGTAIGSSHGCGSSVVIEGLLCVHGDLGVEAVAAAGGAVARGAGGRLAAAGRSGCGGGSHGPSRLSVDAAAHRGAAIPCCRGDAQLFR